MCNCIEETNQLLREKHNTILVTTLFGKPPRCVVRTDVFEKKRGAKAAAMLASYCPFCGKKYDGDS